MLFVQVITWIRVRFGNNCTSNRQSNCTSDSECNYSQKFMWLNANHILRLFQLISVHPPQMRIVFIYTPGHNFLWFTPGQLPKAMVTADRKLSFMYAPGQGHLDCSCPYLCTPTDEDSVQHSLSLICPWTAIPKAMVTPDRSLISCTPLDKGVKTVTAHPNRWG